MLNALAGRMESTRRPVNVDVDEFAVVIAGVDKAPLLSLSTYALMQFKDGGS